MRGETARETREIFDRGSRVAASVGVSGSVSVSDQRVAASMGVSGSVSVSVGGKRIADRGSRIAFRSRSRVPQAARRECAREASRWWRGACGHEVPEGGSSQTATAHATAHGSRQPRAVGRLTLVAAVWFMAAAPARAQHAAGPANAEAVIDLYNQWRFVEAERTLDQLRQRAPGQPETSYAEGYERFLSGVYPEAVAKLKAAAAGAPADELLHLAEGAATSIAGHEERRSQHFVIRFPPEDAVLADYALEALEAASSALGSDLGFVPPRLIPVDILRSPADLALVTALTVEDVERTGTIAVSKWGRIMLTTPRAMRLGYAWLDSLSHELVHYAIAFLTHDRAPVWLQEGLAKFLEHRWRTPPGLDLTPSMQHLLAKGLAGNRLISFEAMHPSMAKLPTAEDASLAFAEVATAVGLLHTTGGAPALRQVLSMVAEGADARLAVARAYGGSGTWADFEKAWRAFMVAQHYKVIPGFEVLAPKYRKRSAIASRRAPLEDEASPGRAGSERFLRLGNMLLQRGRVRAAASEYEKGSKEAGPDMWVFSVKLGRSYLAMGEADRALAAVARVQSLYPEIPWPHLIAGQALLAKGDAAGAVAPLLASLAANPFDPSVHCSLAEAYKKLASDAASADKRQRAERDCRTMTK
jgi:tetratricopeptide (TPR) repeat protein